MKEKVKDQLVSHAVQMVLDSVSGFCQPDEATDKALAENPEEMWSIDLKAKDFLTLRKNYAGLKKMVIQQIEQKEKKKNSRLIVMPGMRNGK